MSVTSKALWYLESHRSGDTSLEAVAEALGLSRFHVSRAFSGSTGYALSAYVRARRLGEAAKALSAGAPDILAVALQAGYGSHEAFTRAFRQHFGTTPERVRAQAELGDLKLLEPIRMNSKTTVSLAPPRFVDGRSQLIFGLGERCATNTGMAAQWDRFLPHFGQIPGQVGQVAYGVMCPTTDAEVWEYVCGVEVKEFPAHPAQFARLTLPPKRYAVFEHRDHISSIGATWQAVWNEALPAAGCRVTDEPFFERYGESFDGRTGLGGVELWVPVNR